MPENTLVTFPAGELAADTTVDRTVSVGDRHGVVCATTPFHPVDHTWPDQPADRGTLTVSGRALPVEDCVIGAAPRDGSAPVSTGDGIAVRRGDPDWNWYVVHLVAEDPGARAGEPVRLEADPQWRLGLSAGHTSCELVGLALNRVLAGWWTKPAKDDALGHPDFDKLAISRSRIHPYGSVDHYRLGKSLRRKGFSADRLADELPDLEAGINAAMERWVAEDAPVGVDTEGPGVAARRHFCCGLSDGAVRVPCGGTHIARTGELGSARVSLSLSEDGSELRMEAACGSAVPLRQ
jgi:alanyl-tRNA synthetase